MRLTRCEEKVLAFLPIGKVVSTGEIDKITKGHFIRGIQQKTLFSLCEKGYVLFQRVFYPSDDGEKEYNYCTYKKIAEYSRVDYMI